MAKKFQTKAEKESARARTHEHLSGDGKKKAKGKKASPAVNGTAHAQPLELKGGVDADEAKEESIKLHFDEMVKRKKTAASSNSRVRAQSAVAKKDKVDTTLLSKMVLWADRDPSEVKSELKRTLRYAEICLPDVQLDLFDADTTSSTTRESQIFDDGFRAGRDARKNQDANPHRKGSLEHEIWADGYMFGQKKNASLIGKTKDSLGDVPRTDTPAH